MLPNISHNRLLFASYYEAIIPTHRFTRKGYFQYAATMRFCACLVALPCFVWVKIEVLPEIVWVLGRTWVVPKGVPSFVSVQRGGNWMGPTQKPEEPHFFPLLLIALT